MQAIINFLIQMEKGCSERNYAQEGLEKDPEDEVLTKGKKGRTTYLPVEKGMYLPLGSFAYLASYSASASK